MYFISSFMVLQMFIGDQLIDSSVLNLIKVNEERQLYIEEVMTELLEKWSEVVNRQNAKVEFFIDGHIFLQE
jgi:hypothetical protein